jgi:hypothetical protein
VVFNRRLAEQRLFLEQFCINTLMAYRINWNKVKEVLEGSRPISDLGCN